MKIKNLFSLIFFTFFIIFLINFVFSQTNKLTLFKTENKGFKFITNQNNNAGFKLDSDSISAYLLFGSSSGFRTVIRPSHYGGSYIYSVVPNDYGGISYNLINLSPEGTSTSFVYNNTARSGVEKYARIYANLKYAIAIYNCSYPAWLNGGTCLGKIGFYSNNNLPPGVRVEGGYYYNPTTCFGNNEGRVLQEICTGDCGYIYDDSALTICVLK